ncbi:MAG: Ig-like domain-containing protein [Verrucomicrobia bacterium]|nr:Ig-like domain-containing protein [Verrucomicrobiota bacterium]
MKLLSRIKTYLLAALVGTILAPYINAAPTVAFTSPATATFTTAAGTTQVLTVTATPDGVTGIAIQRVDFTIGSQVYSVATAPYTYTWSIPSNQAAGNVTITAVAVDTAGVSSTAATRTATITNPLPIITLTPPTPTTLVVGEAVSLSASASVGTGAISRVDFYANGLLLNSDTRDPSTAPYSATFQSPAIGTYSINAIAVDDRGNQTTSTSYSVNVTSGAGTLQGLSPSTLTLGQSARLTLAINSAFDVGGNAIQDVKFYVNGALTDTDTTAPYTYTFTPPAIGDYSITTRITYETSLLTSDTPNKVLTVSPQTAPTVTLSPPSPASLVLGQSSTLTASASSNNVGASLSQVEFFANGTSIGVDLTAPYSLAFTPASAGSYTITAVATDRTTSSTTSASQTLTVTAATPPTVTLSAPSPASLVLGQRSTLTATASSNNVGASLTRVEFFANGTSIGTDLSSPYSLAFTPASAGTYTLTAVATDSIGSSTTSGAQTVTATSGVAPAVSLTADNLIPAVGDTVTLSATATDGDGTISNVRFIAFDSFGATVSLSGTTTDTASPYQYFYIPGAAGIYQFYAIATDNLGNATTSAPVTITVSAITKPSVSFISPTTGFDLAGDLSRLIQIDATAASGRTIQYVEVYVNNARVQQLVKRSASGYYEYRLLAPDSITQRRPGQVISIKAIDSLNTSSDTQDLSFAYTQTIQGTRPSVSLLNPTKPVKLSNGKTQEGISITDVSKIKLYASAFDPDGSIDKVTFTILQGRPASATANITPYIPATPGSGTSPGTPASGGTVDSITITDPGIGYLNPGAISIDIDSSPSGLGADAFVDLPTIYGGLAKITPVNRSGTTYTTAPAVIIEGQLVGQEVFKPSFELGNSSLIATGSRVWTIEIDPQSIGMNPSLNPQGAHQNEYYILIQAIDNQGKINTLVGRGSLPVLEVAASATNRPTVPVLTVSASSAVTGQAITLSATATDSDDKISEIAFFANGKQIGKSDIASPYQISWLPDSAGTYQIVAVVKDESGNLVTSPASTVTVTQSTIVGLLPSITITAPAANATSTAASTILLTASAYDVDGSISSVDFIANGQIVTPTATRQGSSSTWLSNLNFATNNLAAGTYELRALVKDNANNSVISDPVTITVAPAKSAAPTLSLATPSPPTVSQGQTSLLQATPTATTGANITKVDFYSNGSLISTQTAKPYQYNYTVSASGDYTLFAIAYDDQGNSTVSNTTALTARAVFGIPVTAELIDADVIGTKIATGSVMTFSVVATQGDSALQTTTLYATNSKGVATTLGQAARLGTTERFQLRYTNTLSVDTYKVYATVTDANGNVARTGERTIQSIEGTAGSVSVDSPTDGTYNVLETSSFARASAVAILGNANFLDQQITSVKVTNPGLSYAPGTQAILEVINDSVYASAFNVPIVSRSVSLETTLDGQGRITGISVGSIGNTRLLFYQSARIVIPDNFAGSQPLPVRIGYTAQNGVSEIRLYANGVLVGTKSQAPYVINWSPVFAGVYQLHAELIDGKGVLTTSVPRTITISPVSNKLDGVTVNGTTAYKVIDGLYGIIYNRNINSDEVPALNSKFSSSASTEDNQYALAEVAASLVLTDGFRSGGASVILYNLAVLKRAPSISEYTAGLESLTTTGITPTVAAETYLAKLLSSTEYSQNFGQTAELLVVNSTQYPKVQSFALNVYEGIYGAKPKSKGAQNALAQSFMNRFSGLTSNGANSAALIANRLYTYLTEERKGPNGEILEGRLRTVALSYALRNGTVATNAEITARQKLSASSVANNFLNDTSLVETKPVFRVNPVSQSFTAGQTRELSVSVAANPRASLQWFKDKQAIPGATGKTLTVNSAGSYTVVAINAKGKVSSKAAKITVTPVAPVLSTSSVRVARGQSISAVTTSNGKAGLTYYAKGLPSGIAINPSTGVISGVVSEKAKPGTVAAQIWTQSGKARSGSVTLSITVQ